jgi:membrane protein
MNGGGGTADRGGKPDWRRIASGTAFLVWAFARRDKSASTTSAGDTRPPGDSRPPAGAGTQIATRGDERTQRDDAARANQRGRGREATRPQNIPLLGWKDIAWRVYAEIGNDRLLAVAAGVTFYVLLAIFPAIAAFVSIFGMVADRATIGAQLADLDGVLPGGAIEIIGAQVNRITGQDQSALSFAFAFSLLLSIWSANAGVKAMIDALNVTYDEEEKRGFFKLNLVSLTFTVGGILFIAIALSSVVVLPIVLNFVGLGSVSELLLRLARWPVLFAVLVFGLALMYRFGPSRRRPKWRWVTWGSSVAAVLWLAGSILFSWYVSNFGSYNETYGSLGAAVGLMTWIWLSTTVILIGAEVNAEMEHQTAIDSTTGGPRPLGQRGATMADEVGPAQVK